MELECFQMTEPRCGIIEYATMGTKGKTKMHTYRDFPGGPVVKTPCS